MNVRTTLVLFLLAAGLAAWLLLFREHPEQHEGPSNAPVLGSHSLKEAVRIRWSRKGGGAPIDLQREPDGPFRIVEPISDRCSIAFVRSLIGAYDNEPLHEAFPGQQLTAKELGELGFDEPRAVLEAWFPDGSQSKVEIGDEGPLGRDIYVRRDGKVFTGGMGLWSALQVNTPDLRERQVFDNLGTASSLTVEQPAAGGKAERLRLVKRGEKGWYLEEPRRSRTESAAAESFVIQVLSLRIDHFPPMPVQLPEGPPDYVISVEGMLGNEVVKLWRDPSEQLIGWNERRKIAFISSDHQYHQIFGDVANRMRARWLIPIDDLPERLARAVIDQGRDAPRVVVARQGGNVEFRMLEPVITPCRPSRVAELIQAINNLRVIEYVEGKADDKRFGLTEPGLTLEVAALDKPGESTVLRFGADKGGEGESAVTYAQRADEPDQVVAVPRPAVEALRRPWSEYPDRKVAQLQPGTVVEMVTVAGKGSVPKIEYRRTDGRWHRDGQTAPADQVGSAMDEVADLRADGVELLRRLQPGDADRTISLCRANGEAFLQLWAWDRGAGEPLRVRVEARPDLVFALSEGSAAALRKLWQ